ncbi:alanyl-tRNA synthetase [Nitzschia inconspicua]|uniref:Alanyl-tRNA synthetase n=1 Tax=Nitzschia inconspicua TaxID=303405 RepID=A0A9K3PHM2_9STRA|nr:alanyl-tRNA synthetase [Nitzschia inconspicua]
MAPPNDDSIVANVATGVRVVSGQESNDAATTAVMKSRSVDCDNGTTTTDAVPPTEMIYYTYDGNFQLECDAEILSCQFIENNNVVHNNNENGEEKQDTTSSCITSGIVHLALNRTVLHAQGGGQPTDTGVIRLLNNANDEKTDIVVEKILLDRASGVANHIGKLRMASSSPMSSSLSLVGQPVSVHVDAENRQILSECHTAGHVVDMAMAQCDMVMPATKAYHFLDGPYVEYKDDIAAPERPKVLERLQASFQKLVHQDIDTEIYNVTRQEAQELCDRVAQNYFRLQEQFGEDETVRIVKVAGWPCPCGGTHVKSTGVLKQRGWGITGFKCKKGVVRVKYGQGVGLEK